MAKTKEITPKPTASIYMETPPKVTLVTTCDFYSIADLIKMTKKK